MTLDLGTLYHSRVENLTRLLRALRAPVPRRRHLEDASRFRLRLAGTVQRALELDAERAAFRAGGASAASASG